MRTDSILLHMLLTRGQIKIYREGENGVLCITHSTWTACAVSMMCKQKSSESYYGKSSWWCRLIMVPLTLMEKWMMEHRTGIWICSTYRTRFEEVLEVVDNIAFRAMDERLEFY
jgi:CRP/FNR family transcriptional regulator